MGAHNSGAARGPVVAAVGMGWLGTILVNEVNMSDGENDRGAIQGRNTPTLP